MKYLLLLWLLYYQNLKRFHRVVFLEEGAIYHFWHIFFIDFSHKYCGLHCAKTNSMTYSFFIINYLLLLWLLCYKNFKRIHRVVFFEDGAIYHFWHIFNRFPSRNMSPLCKKEFDDIFFFHHEWSSSPMVTLLSKFQKSSPCSFLRRGRYIPLMAYFL